MVSSRSRREVNCRLELQLASDLAPMIEVKAGVASSPGAVRSDNERLGLAIHAGKCRRSLRIASP